MRLPPAPPSARRGPTAPPRADFAGSARPEPSPPPAPGTSADPRPAPAARRVFIVEDHPAVRDGYALVIGLTPDLALAGMAASAEEALVHLPPAAPDLVLVDVSLPGMSGLDLIERLQQTAPGLRTLVVSGHEASVYAERARLAGARGFVPKSAGPAALLDAIRRALAEP